MKIETKQINEIVPYARNPRKNNNAIDYVAASIKEFGFRQPVVIDEENVVIVGHTRLLAAKKLGLDEVPVHIAKGLTPQQVKAYRIADNKTAEYSEFDNELLTLELDELKEADYDLTNTAFDSEELDLLLETENNIVEHRVLSDKFGAPPFSILNAALGYWQDRKRQWNSSINSVLGRKKELMTSGKDTKYGSSFEYMSQSTSVFDPVLCELMYKWFCPPGGSILDPFAGGSVRGIVGSMLGYNYTGIDLSEEQITENIKQWDAINTISNNTITIRVSGKCLRQRFQPCEPSYIKSTCRGRCCQGTDSISVVVHNSEKERIEALGAKVIDGYIQSDSRGLCPFKSDDGLCNIHENKPFGCAASPFTLTNTGMLIVRNRYRLLKCYNTVDALPAYEAHKWSLTQLLGEKQASKASSLAASGEDIIYVEMDIEKFNILSDNHMSRNNVKIKTINKHNLDINWIIGDSRNVLKLANNEYDFIFSCPPYYDLEVYSNDKRDISTLSYDKFIIDYGKIIKDSVSMLKDNRFACFVVGEIRDKKTGIYRSFVADTINAFKSVGMSYYNEIILATPTGTAGLLANRQFSIGRKIVKVHQNILVFVKGDPKKAIQDIGDIDMTIIDEDQS